MQENVPLVVKNNLLLLDVPLEGGQGEGILGVLETPVSELVQQRRQDVLPPLHQDFPSQIDLVKKCQALFRPLVFAVQGESDRVAGAIVVDQKPQVFLFVKVSGQSCHGLAQVLGGAGQLGERQESQVVGQVEAEPIQPHGAGPVLGENIFSPPGRLLRLRLNLPFNLDTLGGLTLEDKVVIFSGPSLHVDNSSGVFAPET